MDLVPGPACTSVLLLFPSSLSMSEAVVDIGVAGFEPVKSDNSSCKKKLSIFMGEIYEESWPNSCNCNVEVVIFEELMIQSLIQLTPSQRSGGKVTVITHTIRCVFM